MTDAKIKSYADRLLALTERHKADMAEVIEEAKQDDVDTSALRRLVAWMRKDEIARLEQEAVDDQYRYLAGLAPEPAALPTEGDLATAAALFADGLTIRAVAKEMGISVGKAHALKVKAAAFNVHRDVNMKTGASVDPALVEMIVQGVQTDIGRKALTTALDAMIEVEESREDVGIGDSPVASEAPESAPLHAAECSETAAPLTDDDLEIPECLRRTA